jgi:hypothetical protein
LHTGVFWARQQINLLFLLLAKLIRIMIREFGSIHSEISAAIINPYGVFSGDYRFNALVGQYQ